MSSTTTITAAPKNGEIVLSPGVNLPNGIVVRIETVEEDVPTLGEILKDFDGVIDDPRTDMAANHTHYLHGHRKA